MQKITVIGGGAAGLACAVFLAKAGVKVTVLERGERLGRKLSATGNGQGNVTNVNMGAEHYFSDDLEKVARALSRFGSRETIAFLESMGGVFLPDARGRVYPASKQASAVTDILRRELSSLGVEVKLNCRVTGISHRNSFLLTTEDGTMSADGVILAAGGMAAPNFGTDGTAYALAQTFGHTVTPLSPALVQLKSDPTKVRSLKGIRMDAGVTILRGEKQLFGGRGDVLFTDSGVSGDAVFRASSHTKKGDTLVIDFLPDISAARLEEVLESGTGEDCLLCVVPNGLGRFLYKQAGGDRKKLICLLKSYALPVTGDLGFARAQVTKGGIPLAEVDETMQSKLQRGLFFAGEILNVDGECGGYNLQWAFTSAYLAAQGVLSC